MGYKFKEGISRRQKLFFPESIEEYLSDTHLAKLVLSMVSKLNLDKIIEKFSKTGQRAYSPVILLSILFYGYAIGIRSSRKLSKACEERIDFMYLSANLKPSYKTISEFRKNNLSEISELFQEIVLIGIKLGLAKLGEIKVSVDGTKIRANASVKYSKDEEGLKKLLSDVKEKVTQILSEAEEIDSAEDKSYGSKRGDELPKELEKAKKRKEQIEKAISDLKEEKEKLRNEVIRERKREGKSENLPKKEEKKINNKKINITDKDANLMKERAGSIKPNYNCQASVDEANQFILACDVTQECNDKHQLIPMLNLTERIILGRIQALKADSGYYSGENLLKLSEKQEMLLLIDDPYKKRLNNENFKYEKLNFKYNEERDSYTCPEGKILRMVSLNKDKKIYKGEHCKECRVSSKCCNNKSKVRKIIRYKHEEYVEANRSRLLTESNKEEYKKRMHTVEPVFGNIKHNTGFRQFSLRGFLKVFGEFNIMCIGHNLKKIFSYCIRNNVNYSECSV